MAEIKTSFTEGVISQFREPIQTSFSPLPEFRPGGFEFAEPADTNLGEIATSFGAGVAAGFTAPVRFLGAGLEVLEDAIGVDLPDLGKVARDSQQWWQKHVGKERSERLAGQVGETISTMFSTIATVGAAGGAVGAGSFSAGAAAAAGGGAPLLALAGGAGLEKTAEALREGAPRLNAYGAGFLTAATEYLTEKIPLGVLQDATLPFFKRLAFGAIADVPGEMLATATELAVIDKRILGKDRHLTIDDYVEIMKDVAAVSVFSSIGMSIGADIIHRNTTLDSEARKDNVLETLEKFVKPGPPDDVKITETQEPTQITQQVRDDSKAEFPEVRKQSDTIIPEERLELTPTTKEESQLDDVEGFDILEEEAFKDNTVSEFITESQGYSKKKRKESKPGLLKTLRRSIVDVSGNLKALLNDLGQEGKRVVQNRVLIAGAHKKAGVMIDGLTRRIYSGLNRQNRDLLDGYIFSKRHLEIRANKGAQFKLPGKITEQAMNDFIDSIPTETKAMLDARAQIFWGAMNSQLEQLNKEGLLTDAKFAEIKEQGEFYSPRQILDWADPLVQTQQGGRTISVRDSGLKRLSDTGSDKLIETDTALLMAQVIARTQTRIFKNRADLEMLRLSRSIPDNGIVREAKIKSRTKKLIEATNKLTGRKSRIEANTLEGAKKLLKDSRGKLFDYRVIRGNLPIYESAEPGFSKISAMENGERREMIMRNDLAAEWIQSDPLLTAGQSNAISWITGTKILRPMATGLNPEFAITNFFRDIAHIWLTTDQYSSFAPKAALQMANDIRQVFSDAITKKGLYSRYIDNGGGMELLSHIGSHVARDTVPKIKGKIGTFAEFMGKAGEISELTTRLALMNRAKKNNLSDQEATFVARNYLDFAQGGSMAKAVDNAIPFLNASIQGTRGIIRGFAENPAVFSYKAMQVSLAAVGLMMANRATNPDAWNEVSDEDKRNSWVVTTPFSFRDKDGNKRYWYFKFAKDQGQRVFATIAENIAKKTLGEPVDADQIAKSIKDFLPILPTEFMPPAMDAWLGFSANVDWWRNEPIWRGPDVLPQEEYNKYTPEVYVKAGQVLNQSPERLQYAVSQYFTSGNVWTSLVGFGAKQAFGDLSEEDNAKVMEEILARKPFVRRLVSVTRPGQKERNAIETERIAASTERFVRTRAFDELTDQFFSGQTDRREINEYIRRQPEEERNRLRNRFKDMRKLEGIPNRSFWLRLKQLPPESRATMYWNQWSVADPQERKELEKIRKKVPGFSSARFKKTFRQLKKLRSAP